MITLEKFIIDAKKFCLISDKLGDGWCFFENHENQHIFLKKDAFVYNKDNLSDVVKAEYVICYNPSFSVPSFSFNMWNSSGVLLDLETVRRLAFQKINQNNFFSVVTQHLKHPLFFRPYFLVHPCQTESLLDLFKDNSKNIIVTFLSIVQPLVKMELSFEYGM